MSAISNSISSRFSAWVRSSTRAPSVTSTPRPRRPCSTRSPACRRCRRRIVRRRRPQPARVRSRHPRDHGARTARQDRAGRQGRRVVAHRPRRERSGGTAAPASLVWAIQEMIMCANPSAMLLLRSGPGNGATPRPRSAPNSSSAGRDGHGQGLGRHHGADRARCRIRCRRRAHEGHRAARRHLAHRRA